jgi:hypothetical protein
MEGGRERGGDRRQPACMSHERREEGCRQSSKQAIEVLPCGTVAAWAAGWRARRSRSSPARTGRGARCRRRRASAAAAVAPPGTASSRRTPWRAIRQNRKSETRLAVWKSLGLSWLAGKARRLLLLYTWCWWRGRGGGESWLVGSEV